MYEINSSTVMLIGINDNSTKVVTLDDEFIVNCSSKEIINYSCKYFGSSLDERVKSTYRLSKIKTKVPIVIEDTRNIIFFPLFSIRNNVNTWISFNNLLNYYKNGSETILNFKNIKQCKLNFSYYIIDNQVTRCLVLDYERKKRRESL